VGFVASCPESGYYEALFLSAGQAGSGPWKRAGRFEWVLDLPPTGKSESYLFSLVGFDSEPVGLRNASGAAENAFNA
jgi:hypothetical protein